VTDLTNCLHIDNHLTYLLCNLYNLLYILNIYIYTQNYALNNGFVVKLSLVHYEMMALFFFFFFFLFFWCFDVIVVDVLGV
jgi:hypothetical protein